jgi:TPR repeat protein
MSKQPLALLIITPLVLFGGCSVEETSYPGSCAFTSADDPRLASASWEDYLESVLSDCDPEVLLVILDGLSKRGDSRAMHQQAVILLHKDREQALDLMRKSAALGNEDAAESLESFERTGEF